jgi:hypothetical protein
MRDFRDAKAMAHTLREALKARDVTTTHSECLELIAKAFGYDNWNILSAKVEAAQSAARDRSAPEPATIAAAPDPTLYCSFCGKSQHEVRKLIAGPTVFICDACVALCDDIVEEEKILDSFAADGEHDVIPDADRAGRHVERWRFVLEQIKRKLAMRDGEAPAAGDALAAPGFAFLRNKTRDELQVLQRQRERALQRFEEMQHRAGSTARSE